jgi:hypothetical protein
MSIRTHKTRNSDELQKLLTELREVGSELSESFAEFNRVTDNDMIESAVYKLNSLHGRYNFVLRQIKSLANTTNTTGSERRLPA